MSENNDKTVEQKIAGFAVGLATMIGAATGLSGCHADDIPCQVQQLHDSQEIAKNQTRRDEPKK